MSTERFTGRLAGSNAATSLAVVMLVILSSTTVAAITVFSSDFSEYSEGTTNPNGWDEGVVNNSRLELNAETANENAHNVTLDNLSTKAVVEARPGEQGMTVYMISGNDEINMFLSPANDDVQAQAIDDDGTVQSKTAPGPVAADVEYTVHMDTNATHIIVNATGENGDAWEFAFDRGSIATTDWNLRVSSNSETVFVHEYALNTQLPSEQPTVSGTVTADGSPVENVTVEFGNSSTTTDLNGEYSLNVANGTYTAVAKKSGFTTDQKSVTVSGDTTVDFQIREVNDSLRIRTSEFVRHGDTVPFAVEHYNETSDEWENVTNSPNLTVTVETPQIVTVGNGTITATSNTSVNDVTFINANYSVDGSQASQRIVVANETIENVDILPPLQKWTATIGDDNSLVIIVATAVAAGVALYATSLAGLGAFALVIIGGWLGGWTADHTVIAAILITLFVGLNVSQLVEFRRT